MHKLCTLGTRAGQTALRILITALTIIGIASAFSGASGSGAGKKAEKAAAAKANAKAEKRAETNHAIQGAIEVSLIWDGLNDLDLAVEAPGGTRIDANQRTGAGGRLDLDFNYTPMDTMGSMRYKAGLTVDEVHIIPIDEAAESAGGRFSEEPIEHVYWSRNSALEGLYRIKVQQFYNREHAKSTTYSVVVTIDRKVVATFEGKFGAQDVVRDGEGEALAGTFKYPFIPGGKS